MGAWRFYFELPDYKFEDSSLMYISGETQIGVVPLAERAGYVFVLQPCASDYWMRKIPGLIESKRFS